MTEPTDQDDEPARSLYAEPGSTWWPVLWGPGFAVLGAGVEALTGPVHALAWTVVGLGLAIGATVWVQARRRICAVRLTSTALFQGRERLAVDRIAEIDEVGQPIGARVLGGGWTVPKRFAEVPLRLRDGGVVVAWAKHPDALRAALGPLINSSKGDS